MSRQKSPDPGRIFLGSDWKYELWVYSFDRNTYNPNSKMSKMLEESMRHVEPQDVTPTK